MTISLRPITSHNLWAVLDLKLHPGQEDFVAENAVSIADANAKPSFVPLVVGPGEEVAGLDMMGTSRSLPLIGWAQRTHMSRERMRLWIACEMPGAEGLCHHEA